MAKFNEKYFGGTADPYDISSVLSDSEQIIWRGKPNRKAFILAQFFKMFPVALIWLLFDGGAITALAVSGAFSEMPPFARIFIIVFFAIHLIPVWLWLSNVITASAKHKNIEYAFTDTRIIIKSGLIGLDVANVYYADIESVNVKVGLTDKILGVGDIYIKSKNHAHVLWDLEKPYELTNHLQKVVHDLKTDTYFPNELRPAENKGFDTRYSAESGPEDKPQI